MVTDGNEDEVSATRLGVDMNLSISTTDNAQGYLKIF